MQLPLQQQYSCVLSCTAEKLMRDLEVTILEEQRLAAEDDAKAKEEAEKAAAATTAAAPPPHSGAMQVQAAADSGSGSSC